MNRVVSIIIFIVVWFIVWIIVEYCIMKNSNLHRLVHPEKYEGYAYIQPLSNKIHKRVKKGKKIASQSKLVICGLARDIHKQLEKTIPRLEFIGKQFKKYKIIIFENDSSDGTRDLIKKWASKNKNVILLDCCDEGDCDCRLKEKQSYENDILAQDRIERMSRFRNKYLDVVKQKYNDYDWMLVADLDLEGKSSIDGLMHSLTFDEYDAIAMNGRCGVPGLLGNATMAYDAMAYIDINDTCSNKKHVKHRDLVKKLLQMNYKISKTKDGKITSVNSAFNGMALYRLSKIKDAQYVPMGGCEHIGFHYSVPMRMGINKEWVGYSGHQGKRDFSTLAKILS